MKRWLLLVVLFLLTIPAVSATSAIVGRGPDGSALVSRLHHLVPAPFLNTPKTVTVESMSPFEMEMMFGTDNILAYYTRDLHIYIRSDLEGFDRDRVLVHEYGHFVWFNELSLRERQAYVRVWKGETYSPDEYRTSSSEEGFAEAFSFYVCSITVCRHRAEDVFVRDAQYRIEDRLKSRP